LEVRHRGSALPQNRTALSEESFVAAQQYDAMPAKTGGAEAAPTRGFSGGRPGGFPATRSTERRCNIEPAGVPLRTVFQVTLRGTELNPQEPYAFAAALFQFSVQTGK